LRFLNKRFINSQLKSLSTCRNDKKEYSCENTAFSSIFDRKGRFEMKFFKKNLIRGLNNSLLLCNLIRGSIIGSISFSSLVDIGSNIHADDLTSVENSSSPIAMDKWFSSGTLQCTVCCDTVVDSCMVIIISLILSILLAKKFIKSLLQCCLEMPGVKALFLVNLVTVSNKYLGFCLRSSKRV